MSASSDGASAVTAPPAAVSLFSSAAHCRSAHYFLSSVSPRCSLSAAPRLFYPSLLLVEPSPPSAVAAQFLRSIALEAPFDSDPAFHLRALRHFYASRVEQLQRVAAHQQLPSTRGSPTTAAVTATHSNDAASRCAVSEQLLPQPQPQPSSSTALPTVLLSGGSGVGSCSGSSIGHGSETDLRAATCPSPHAASALEAALSIAQPAFVLPHQPTLLGSVAESLHLAARLTSTLGSSAGSSDAAVSLPLAHPMPSASLSVASALSFRRHRAFPAPTAGSGTATIGGGGATDVAQQEPQSDDDDDHSMHHTVPVADHTVQRSRGLLLSGRSMASSSEQWEKEAVSHGYSPTRHVVQRSPPPRVSLAHGCCRYSWYGTVVDSRHPRRSTAFHILQGAHSSLPLSPPSILALSVRAHTSRLLILGAATLTRLSLLICPSW